MEKNYFWLMSTKINTAFFSIFGGFFTLIAIGFAENRFEHEPIIYLLLSMIWLIVVLNLVSFFIIKKRIDQNIDISIFHKVLISITMIGVLFILFSSPQHNWSVPYHQPRKSDLDQNE